MNETIQAFVINLAEDFARLAKITAAFSRLNAFTMTRVPAIKGSDLPKVARFILCDHEAWSIQKGEIGCFLSHVKAWELVAESTDKYCLIVEDDVVFDGIQRLITARLPDDFDIVYLNDRICFGTDNPPSNLSPRFIPIAECLPGLVERGGGAGADGYLLTPKGASKLLASIAADFCFGHVDGRLLRYSFSEADLGGVFADSTFAGILRTHHNPHHPPAWGVLKAYCSDTPLVRFGTEGSSRIRVNLL